MTAVGLPTDLSDLGETRTAGERLARIVEPGTTLIHNAGIWPHRLERTRDGLERAAVGNHLVPSSFIRGW